MNMNIKLEQLQKAFDDAKAASFRVDCDDYDADWAALAAYWKAMQELRDYKKEHGL